MVFVFINIFFIKLKRIFRAALQTFTWLSQRRRLNKLLDFHRQPFTRTTGVQQFNGPGWDLLLQAARENVCVLVGEDHGTRETAWLTHALAEVINPRIYVAEIDPYQARDLAALSMEWDMPTSYLRAHPGGLSFYGWVEEYELIHYLMHSGVQIIGIDQVFAASTGRHFMRMAEVATIESVKAYLLHWAAIYQAQDRRTQEVGTTEFIMFTEPVSAFDKLLNTVKEEGIEIRKMAEDYVLSCKIYRDQLEGRGGHKERVSLLKRNLLGGLHSYHWHAGQPLPKLLLKMGAVHAARNVSPLVDGEFFDVGSLLQNLVDLHGQQSLHLLIIGKQGTKAQELQPADPIKNILYYTADEVPFLKPFFDLTHTAWELFDLRPIRRFLINGELGVRHRDLFRTILGYDFLIVVPETVASRNFQ
jgi:hypothetical protein